MPQTKSLPVLMHHYISKHKNSIAVHPDIFEKQCKAMAEKGWRGISLEEAENYFVQGKDLPAKSCLITFDDGFLDNYVYAFPILKKYSHKGVIFPVVNRIMASDKPRPTLEDLWQGSLATNLPQVDNPYLTSENGYMVKNDLFINWEEARVMEKEGTIKLALHSMSHQSVFINNQYSGFSLPEKRDRTFDRTDLFCWGLPQFKQASGLANRAFIPDEELVKKIKDLVPQEENEAFIFSQSEVKLESLKKLVESHKSLGHFESDKEMQERMTREIVDGKLIMEKELGHKIKTICWPWGVYNQLSLKIAQDAGAYGLYHHSKRP